VPFIANNLNEMIHATRGRIFLIFVPLGVITFAIDVTSDVGWLRWTALIWVVAVPVWFLLHRQYRKADKTSG
jgi:hypothetical protein